MLEGKEIEREDCVDMNEQIAKILTKEGVKDTTMRN